MRDDEMREATEAKGTTAGGSSPSPVGAWLRARMRDPRTWSFLGCVAVVVLFAAPMLVYCPRGASACQLSLNRLGSTDDQRYFAALWEATRVTIGTFHQFPSWNPYHCGGIVLYQDPQAPFPGPLFLLTFFWLPTAVGIKVWVFAHLLCGAFGARALIADRGGNAAEQVLGATLMAACGFMSEHIGGGHLSFTPFLFLPLMLWGFRRALVDLRYGVLVAALLALADIEGGTYPVPLMAVALGFECASRLGSAADRRALARLVPTIGVLFVLFAAVRALPVFAYLREHPRLMPLDDRISLGEVFEFWTSRFHGRGVPGHGYVWPEYDCYVGVVPVALMLAGAAVALLDRGARDRRARRIDLAVFVGLVWCALGNLRGLSLFGLLHQLPIYASLRVPSRFLGPAMVGFGLLAVGALTAARAALGKWRPGMARAFLVGELILVAYVAVDVGLTNQTVIQQGIEPVLPRVPARGDFFQNSAANYSRFPTFAVGGFGTRSCYAPLEWKPAPGLVDGRVPQAWTTPPLAGNVAQTGWSPNEIGLDVRLDGPATVVMNQNYESGWRLEGDDRVGTVGAFVATENRFWDIRARPQDLPAKGAIGLLAVRLPAGAHHLVLRHRPPGLRLGLLLTLVGVALAAVIIWRGSKSARKDRVGSPMDLPWI